MLESILRGRKQRIDIPSVTEVNKNNTFHFNNVRKHSTDSFVSSPVDISPALEAAFSYACLFHYTPFLVGKNPTHPTVFSFRLAKHFVRSWKMPLYYFAIEPQSKQFPSRGDIVTFNVNVGEEADAD